MTDTQMSTESFFVLLNKLDRDPKNVRKTYSKEGITEMAATIRADGYPLLQNIIVRKRMALWRISPVLLELHRQEEMTFQQLSAFTVSDDHDRQVEVWNSLPS